MNNLYDQCKFYYELNRKVKEAVRDERLTRTKTYDNHIRIQDVPILSVLFVLTWKDKRFVNSKDIFEATINSGSYDTTFRVEVIRVMNRLRKTGLVIKSRNSRRKGQKGVSYRITAKGVEVLQKRIFKVEKLY